MQSGGMDQFLEVLLFRKPVLDEETFWNFSGKQREKIESFSSNTIKQVETL